MTNPFNPKFPSQEFIHRFSQTIDISEAEVILTSSQTLNIPTLNTNFTIIWSAVSTPGIINKLLQDSLNTATTTLLVTPFMTEGAKTICRQHEISWFDLSGNAHILLPNVRIIIEGKPNQYKEVGRPSNTFAPKSSRVTRWLLMHPHQAWKQKEIAQNTDMSEAFVSRIIKSLEADFYIQKTKSGIQITDWQLLFDAWLEQYHFDKHTIIKGHIPSRSSETTIQSIHNTLQSQDIDYALTGLAAAWRYTQFANFHLSTFFLSEYPLSTVLQSIGFRQTDSGANTWLVIPNDEGVFQEKRIVDGIPCVHPIQVCMDVIGHPERAQEAREAVLQYILPIET